MASNTHTRHRRDRYYLQLAKMHVKSIITGAILEPSFKQKRIPPKSSITYQREQPSASQFFRDAEQDKLQSVCRPDCFAGQENGGIGTLVSSIADIKQDLVSVKGNIAEIKAKQDQSQRQAPLDVDALGLLLQSILKAIGRLDEISSLRCDVELLQQRLKRIEDDRRISQKPHTPDADRAHDRACTDSSRRQSISGVHGIVDGPATLTPKLPPPAAPLSAPRGRTHSSSLPRKALPTANIERTLQATQSDQNTSSDAHPSSFTNSYEDTSSVDHCDRRRESVSESREDAGSLKKDVQPSHPKAYIQNTDHQPFKYSSKRRRTDSNGPFKPADPSPSLEALKKTPQHSHTGRFRAQGALNIDPYKFRQTVNGEFHNRSLRSRTGGRESLLSETGRPSRALSKRARIRAKESRDSEGYLLRQNGSRDKRSVLRLSEKKKGQHVSRSPAQAE
ncbi:MAG: hypothetical protein Q9217_001142 [Psora testacea]